MAMLKSNALPLAHSFGEQAVASEYFVEPLRKDHVERSAQREKQMLRRSARIFLVVHVAVPSGPVPIGRSQSRALVRRAGTTVDGHEAEAGWRHQAFLRSRHGDIHAPRI